MDVVVPLMTGCALIAMGTNWYIGSGLFFLVLAGCNLYEHYRGK